MLYGIIVNVWLVTNEEAVKAYLVISMMISRNSCDSQKCGLVDPKYERQIEATHRLASLAR